MLKVFVGSEKTNKIISYQKKNNHYQIPVSQITLLQQIVDQVVYQNFGHSKSQITNLIQLVIKNLLKLQFSISDLTSLFETIQKQEKRIRKIQDYFLACQNILQDDLDSIQKSKEFQKQLSEPVISEFNAKDDQYLSQTCQFGSPNVSCQQDPIDYDFWNTCDKYLEIDNFKNQHINRSSISEKKAKLRIEGLVSSYNFNCFKNKSKVKGESQIKVWQKKIKKSILNQTNLQKAAIDFVPYSNDQNYLKELQYRNKIKNTKLRNRLSKNLL